MKKDLKVDNKMIEDLYEVLLSLESKEECAKLLEDLCTKQEVEQMACRIKAARLLMENKTYNEVIEKTNISSATLSRISRCVKYGEGYNYTLNKSNKTAK
ncbi:MAG: YerC/YecD family TrpR-related protein [Erysipelotrichaceae bacterium]|nr:YerC/YecD family TrpR-related protein [Erysipelotrichaceae bacterium]